MSTEKITIPRSELCSAVSAVVPGWKKSGTVDYHQTLLLDCQDGRLALATASGMGHVWTSIDVDSDVRFRLAVPTQSMSEFCSSCRSEVLEIGIGGNKLELSGSRGQLKLAFQDTQPENIKGWPSLPAVSEQSGVGIIADDLLYALRAAAGATDESSATYDLGSVHVEIEGDVAHFWATDGRMMAVAKVPCVRAEGDDARIVMSIPADTARVIGSVLRASTTGLDGSVRLSLSANGNQVIVASESSTMVLALSAGNRPRDFLKRAHGYVSEAKALSATLSKSELASAVRAALIGFDALDDLGAAVILASDGEDVRVLSNARSENQIDVPLGATEVSGSAAMLINKAFLMSLVTSCGKDAFKLEIAEFGSGSSTGQRALISTDDGRFFGVAMGMQLDGDNLTKARAAMAGELVGA